MESPELINNGYAIVTNAHRRTLHITGSQTTNWLDVSSIPVPLTDVMILQQLDGKVRLKCQVPGPKIYYTTDGSQPTPQSPVYEDPFPIRDNMIVNAVAVEANRTATGVATRRFGVLKTGWKVISANGHVDGTEAKERAARLFDGDGAVCWVTDVGEGSSAYPFEVVIDLGGRKTIRTVETHFPLEVAAAKTIEVSGANSPSGPFGSLGQATISKFQKTVGTTLDAPSEIQFLKLDFRQPLKDGVPLLMVGEIELR